MIIEIPLYPPDDPFLSLGYLTQSELGTRWTAADERHERREQERQEDATMERLREKYLYPAQRWEP